MLINRINIRSFGCLKDKQIIVNDGLNIIEGQNEAGKSTVMAFILYIFYGYNADISSYILRSGGAEGCISVTDSKGATFLIERTTAVSAKKSIDKTNVLLLPSMSEIKCDMSPGEYFFGMSREIFVNSVFTSQSGASSFNAKEASSAIQNILLSGNDKYNPDKALSKLNVLRRLFSLTRGSGGIISDIEKEISSIKNEIYFTKESERQTKEDEAELLRLKEESNKLSILTDAILTEKKARLGSKIKASKQELVNAEEALEDKKNVFLAKSEKLLEYKNNNIGNTLRACRVRIELHRSRAEVVRIELKELERSKDFTSTDNPMQAKDCDELISNVMLSRIYIQKQKNAAILAFLMSALVFILGIVFATAVNVFASLLLFVLSAICLITGFILLSKRKAKIKFLCEKLSKYGFSADTSVSEIREKFERDVMAEAEKQRIIELREQKEAEIAKEEALLSASLIELYSISDMFVPERDGLTDDKLIELCEEKLEDAARECQILDSDVKETEDRIEKLKKFLSEHSEIDEYPEKNASLLGVSDIMLDTKIRELISDKEETSEKINVLSGKVTLAKNNVVNITEAEARLTSLNEALTERKKQLSIIYLAENTIKNASKNVKTTLTPELILSGEKLLCRFTDGKYQGLGIDDELNLNGISDGNTSREANPSYGTKEAVYLALRLALSGILCRGETPPIMLDESLAHIDDKRSCEILSMLSESEMQSFVFTCTARDASLSTSAGIKHTKIIL